MSRKRGADVRAFCKASAGVLLIVNGAMHFAASERTLWTPSYGNAWVFTTRVNF